MANSSSSLSGLCAKMVICGRHDKTRRQCKRSSLASSSSSSAGLRARMVICIKHNKAHQLLLLCNKLSLGTAAVLLTNLRARMVMCTRRNEAQQRLVLRHLQGCCFKAEPGAVGWLIMCTAHSLAESALSAHRRCLTLSNIRKALLLLLLLLLTKQDTQTCQDCWQGRIQQCMPYYGI